MSRWGYGMVRIILIVALFATVLSSCQLYKGENDQDQKEISLSVWIEREVLTSSDQIHNQIISVLSSRFPKLLFDTNNSSYISMWTGLPKMLQTSPHFDLMIAHEYTLPMMFRSGMMSQIYSEGIEQLSQIEEFYIENIRSMDRERHELYAVPVSAEYIGMYYSPDQIRSMGLTLPEDGVTWQQFAEMGHSIDGKSIYINKQTIRFMMSQVGLRFINPKTNQIDVQNEEWAQFATKLQPLLQAPGNEQLLKWKNIYTYGSYEHLDSVFKVERINSGIRSVAGNGDDFDIASVPVPDSNPNAGVEPFLYGAFIPPESKHQAEAMEVINYLLTPEVQALLSSKGRGTVLRDESIVKTFGSSIYYFNGKNLAALTKFTPIPSNRLETYISWNMYDVAEFVLLRLMNQSVDQTLKELDEELNKVLRDEEIEIETINEEKRKLTDLINSN